MRHRFLMLVALAGAMPAGAQIIRPPVRATQPTAWVSLGVGLLQLQGLSDGSTGSTWDFGSGAIAYRVSLEKPLEGRSTIGVSAAFARAPLRYENVATTPAGGASLTSYDADANVTQLLASFHNGGGTLGFHQVIEISAGAQVYANFRARDDGRRLGPADPDVDLALGIGYGFGYAISPASSLEIVQEAGVTVHQRTGLGASANTTPRFYTTRVGMRFGLGR